MPVRSMDRSLTHFLPSTTSPRAIYYRITTRSRRRGQQETTTDTTVDIVAVYSPEADYGLNTAIPSSNENALPVANHGSQMYVYLFRRLVEVRLTMKSNQI